jgi:hypothetical protein
MPIGSYVEVSSGGDQDILSFYSTTASSTWKDPGRGLYHKSIKEIETGYSKNSVARYQISSEREPKLTTTYRQAVHENLSRIMSAGIASVFIYLSLLEKLHDLKCFFFCFLARPTSETDIQRNQLWWRLSHFRPVLLYFHYTRFDLSVTSIFILQAIAHQVAGRPISAMVSAFNLKVRPRQKAQAWPHRTRKRRNGS